MRCLIGVVVATVMAARVAAADPVEGVWQTEPGDDGYYTHVTISQCGAGICGTLGRAFDPAGVEVPSPYDGQPMIWDMRAGGEGQYSGGKIWAPDRDKTYNSRMTLDGDQLIVKGCVLGICRGQTWMRVR